MKDKLLHYLELNGKSPVDYVLSKFEQSDIVLIGEMHRVKQQLELYHKIIPRLPEFGISAIAYEFARREDQVLIDELLDKADFDLDLAKMIMIKQEAFWGFKEYLEIFRLVWSTNKQYPQSQAIKIIGLNDPINWKLYNHICQTERRNPNSEEIAEIWNGCGEKYWLEPVVKHYSSGKTKIVGIMGSHHAFTKYREPSWNVCEGEKVFTGFNTKSFGNYLYEKYGDIVFNVSFYDPWEDCFEAKKLIQPANGVIEQIISPVYQEIGFDLIKSPWGELKDISIYSLGYPDLKLKDIYDGMIYTGRIQDLRPVNPLSDFINENNIQLFRDYVPFNDAPNKNITDINSIIAADAKI